MPSYWKGKTSLSVWVSEDVKYRLAVIAEELGYSSLSDFVEDVFMEVLAAADLSKSLGIRGEGRRKLVLEAVFAKIAAKLRFK